MSGLIASLIDITPDFVNTKKQRFTKFLSGGITSLIFRYSIFNNNIVLRKIFLDCLTLFQAISKLHR